MLTENKVKDWLTDNQDMMELLGIVNDLGLRDSWIAAGTIRNYLWNQLSGTNERDTLTDVDVVFFDKEMPDERVTQIEETLLKDYPSYQWELRNQVWMHKHNSNTLPYKNTKDAIFHYPETVTAIGVRLNQGAIELFAPYGLEDIENFLIKPTPYFLQDKARKECFNQRIQSKNWQKKWPQLTIQWAE